MSLFGGLRSIATNGTHVGLVFNPTFKIKYMKKHLIKFLEIALGYNEEESLISKEGYEILADPIKRAKLRQWIEMYKETGEWDFGFWDESKDEKLSQHDVMAELPFTSDCCNAKAEAIHVCTKCHNWCVGN